MAEVVRFLNHATRAPAVGTSLREASDLSAVVGSLGQLDHRGSRTAAELRAALTERNTG
ncbi:MAG: hypothetical protein ACR2GH_02350 [Pseudonocardia sp.]